MTNRLRIRLVAPDDAEQVTEWRKDPAVMRFLGGPLDVSVKQTRKALSDATGALFLIVELIDDLSPIGFAGLVFDEMLGSADPFIALAPASQNRGYGPEVLRALMSAWDAAVSAPLLTTLTPGNTAAIQIAEQCGFTRLKRLHVDRIGQKRLIYRATFRAHRYSLRRVVIGNPIAVTLTRARYHALADSRLGIIAARDIEHRFDIVISNYYEFELALLEATLWDLTNNSIKAESFSQQRLVLMRRLMNLLSTFRVYADHVSHLVSQVFGSGSIEAEATKRAMSAQYDSQLSYRVIEALRNWTQHRGQPIDTVTYHGAWIEDSHGRRLRHATSIHLEVATLMREEGFKPNVLAELLKGSPSLDLKASIREYVTALSVVHKSVRGILHPHEERWDTELDRALASWRRKAGKGSKSIGLTAVRNFEANRFDQDIPLPFEPRNERDRLRDKNRELVNLVKRYVSSEIV